MRPIAAELPFAPRGLRLDPRRGRVRLPPPRERAEDCPRTHRRLPARRRRAKLTLALSPPQHYELIPQPTLAAAEASLRDEIGPAISVLLDRADSHIDRVERRIESLKARAELQQGRLTETSSAPSSTSYGKRKERGSGSGGGRLGEEAKLRAKVVRQRKEALQYSVERLELEVLQKERELRKQIENA